MFSTPTKCNYEDTKTRRTFSTRWSSSCLRAFVVAFPWVATRSSPRITRLGRQARVLDRNPDREVIQRLERVIGQAEDLVDRIVVKAADAGAARAGGFGGEVQHLTDNPRFPEQVTIERRAERVEARVELGDHPQT